VAQQWYAEVTGHDSVNAGETVVTPIITITAAS
jgi:hypothetical protein